MGRAKLRSSVKQSYLRAASARDMCETFTFWPAANVGTTRTKGSETLSDATPGWYCFSTGRIMTLTPYGSGVRGFVPS